MKFNVKFWSTEQYLPTKKHRKLRDRRVENTVSVNVKEMVEKDFPVAFIVKDYDYVYEESGRDPEYKQITTEIRAYQGRLWEAQSYANYVSRKPGWIPAAEVPSLLVESKPWCIGGEEFTENSIIKGNDEEERRAEIVQKADGYLIFDDKVWAPCGEPMYVINTFGLGHNHGGTGFFITYHYNSNISKDCYFNALQREEAIAYGKKVAAARGDTKSIDGMGDRDIIEVVMPEMVKRNPQMEHGEGDSFLNSVEAMIQTTSSNAEAGALAMAMCMQEINS